MVERYHNQEFQVKLPEKKRVEMQIVSKTLPLSARVQKGLQTVEESRLHKKSVWGEGLTVLDEETVKLPLVIRKALAIKKVLSEMPVGIKDYELLVGERVIWADDLYAVLEQHEPVKFIIVAEEPEADLIEKEMRDRFEGRMEVMRSHVLFVEGNPLGVSKGDALRRLAAHLSIPQAQVMAVGDQGNDAPMIDWAGVGVAMGDGSAAAKAVADWIAPPLEEDGAAVAIERFVLAEASV